MLNLNDSLKSLIVKDVPHDGTFADFSLSNIYDILYLAQYASEGQVYAFTSCTAIIEETSRVLEENFQDNVALINDSPANLGDYINGFIDSATYCISGISPDALCAMEKIIAVLRPEGRLLLICDALNVNACEVYLKSMGNGFEIFRINNIMDTAQNTFFVLQKTFSGK